MGETFFICPKCGVINKRDKHYYVILKAQKDFDELMGNKETTDMCSNCNYFEEVK